MAGNDQYTKLLIHADGENNSTTFVDSSASGHSITAVGNAKISTSQSKFGGSALRMVEDTDYLSIPHNIEHYLDHADWTVDFWFRYEGLSTDYYVPLSKINEASPNQGWSIEIAPEWDTGIGKIYFSAYNVSGLIALAFDAQTPVLVQSTWYHIAFVYSNSTPKIFLNGTSYTLDDSEVPDTDTNYNANTPLIIGYENSYAEWCNGYIDEIRISKGVARWVSNFTPPNSAYSNDDVSITVPAITTQETCIVTINLIDINYALIPATSATNPVLITYSGALNTGQYTASAPIWKLFDHYPTQFISSIGPVGEEVYNTDEYSGGFRAVLLNFGDNPKCFDGFRFCASWYMQEYFTIDHLVIQAANETVGVTDAIDDLKWTILFNDDTPYNWERGSWQARLDFSNYETYKYYRIIPANTFGSEWAASEFLFFERVVPEGSASLYVPEIIINNELPIIVKSFIPIIIVPEIVVQESITVLVNAQIIGIDDHTVLMLHMDGVNESQNFVDSSQYGHEIVVTGTPQIWDDGGQTAAFGGCGLFDGWQQPTVYTASFQYLNIVNSSQFDLGLINTPFCIDFWMEVSFDYVTNPIILMRGDSTNGIAYQIQLIKENGVIRFTFKTSTGTSSIEWAGVTWYSWHHFAITYDGTTTRLFIDGVRRGTPVTDEYVKPSYCAILTIGNNPIPVFQTMFIGRLDEFRISSGVPRWVSDFLPPDRSYEVFSLGREIVIPEIINHETISVSRLLMIPGPIVVPDIYTPIVLSFASISPPGWKLNVPIIYLLESLNTQLSIVQHPVLSTVTTFSVKVLCRIPYIPVSDIVNNHVLAVVDVFLGSKVQVPEIITVENLNFIGDFGWRYVQSVQPVVMGMHLTSTSRTGEHILCYSNYKFYVSHDYGLTWLVIYPLLNVSGGRIVTWVIDDTGQYISFVYEMWLGNYWQQFVMESFNGGVTWSEGVRFSFGLNAVANNDLSIRIYQGKLSLDSGVTWSDFDPNPGTNQPIDDYTPGHFIHIHYKMSGNGTILYAYGSFNIDAHPELEPYYRYEDSGFAIAVSYNNAATWEIKHIAPDQTPGTTWIDPFKVSSLEWVSTDGSTLLVSSMMGTQILDYGIVDMLLYYVSTDYGDTWVRVNPPVSLIRHDGGWWDITDLGSVYHEAYAFNSWSLKIAEDGITSVASVENGYSYISTDSFLTWERFNIGNTDASTLTVDLFSSSDDFVLLTSFGVEEPTTTRLKISDLSYIVINPDKFYTPVIQEFSMDSTATVMLSASDRLNISTLSGVVWNTVFGSGWVVQFTAISISRDGQVILASSNAPFVGGRLFLTLDGGDIWRHLSPELVWDPPTGALSPIDACLWGCCGVSGDGQILIAGIQLKAGPGEAKLFKSVDNGVTWSECSGFSSQAEWWSSNVSINYDGSVILVGDGIELFKYVNGTWGKVSPVVLLISAGWANAISYTGEIMLAGYMHYSNPGRLYKSVDYGSIWTEVQPDGDIEKQWSTCSMSDDGLVMLAGTQDGQLFKSINSGVTWEEQLFSSTVNDIRNYAPSFVSSAVSGDGLVCYACGTGLWTNLTQSSEPITLLIAIPDI